MKKQRIYILDLLRAIAIFLVLGIHILREIATFYHPVWLVNLTQYFGVKDFFWVTLAGIGVVLFIILSGMVLEYNHGEEKYSYFSFIYKRLKRIYFTYWLCLALAIFLIGSASRLWLDATGLMIFSGKAWGSFAIPTAWFLGLILCLYLFYPLLSRSIKKSPYITLAILLIVSFISRIWIVETNFIHRGIDSFPLSRIFEFGLGIFLMQKPAVVRFLSSLNKFSSSKILLFISDISFPVFLIHSVLIDLNIISSKDILGTTLEFVILTLGLSLIVFYTEKKLAKIRFERVQ